MSTTTLWQILAPCIVAGVVGFVILVAAAPKPKRATPRGGEVRPRPAGDVGIELVLPGSLSSGPLNLSCPDGECPTCDVPPEPDLLDEHFDEVLQMLNGIPSDPSLDPMVERIVAMVHEAIASAEAVELDECEAEFLADPMHFGRAE